MLTNPPGGPAPGAAEAIFSEDSFDLIVWVLDVDASHLGQPRGHVVTTMVRAEHGFIEEPREISFSKRSIHLQAWGVASTLEPLEAHPVAHWQDKSVAAVCRDYGKGKAILLGWHIGLQPAVAERPLKGAVKLVEWLAHIAGLEKTVQLKGIKGAVTSRLLRAKGKTVLFLFNCDSGVERVRILKPAFRDAIELLKEARMVTAASNPIIELPPYAVAILVGSELPKKR